MSNNYCALTACVLLMLLASTNYAAAAGSRGANHTAARQRSRSNRQHKPQVSDPELFHGSLSFDFDSDTKLDRTDQRSWLSAPAQTPLAPSPRSLSALEQAVALQQRFIVGRAQIHGRDGDYTAVASSPVEMTDMYEPQRKVPEVQHRTDLQVFAADGHLADELGPFDRGQTLLAVTPMASLDWIYFSTMFDGAYLFELQPGGRAQLVLHCEQRYPSLPAFDVRDLEGDGISEILIPAGEAWRFAVADIDGPGYLDSTQLRRGSTDQELSDAQRIPPERLTDGVFILTYLDLAEQDPAKQHFVWVDCWTPGRWQWAQTTLGLQARENAERRQQQRDYPKEPARP